MAARPLSRIQSEIDHCLNGVPDDSRHGDDILWLMGWADWSVEKQMIEEQSKKEETNAI